MTKLRINMRYLSGSLLLAALVSGCASQAPQRAGGEVGASSSAPAAPAAASGERYAMTGDATRLRRRMSAPYPMPSRESKRLPGRATVPPMKCGAKPITCCPTHAAMRARVRRLGMVKNSTATPRPTVRFTTCTKCRQLTARSRCPPLPGSPV